MLSVRDAVRKALSFLPLVSRLVKEVEDLRKQNVDLKSDLRYSQSELAAARDDFEAANQELGRLKRAHEAAVIGWEPVWVPPGHFFSPIPSIAELQASQNEIFQIPPAVRGVDLNESGQLELLKAFRETYGEQPFSPEKTSNRRYFFENEAYSYGDAVILYSMIRYLRPQRIVEVGAGYSSACMLDVNELFFDNAIDCTFIDPYPQLLRSLIKDSDRQRIRILGQKVQDVDDDVFRQLEARDILFIDSSHITKTGSDVNYIVFKILPLLAGGIFIHFHDIFYPFEYPEDWAFEGRSWNEAYLLRAFLQYNHSFRIRFFSSYLMHAHRELLESALPLSVKNSGGSIWLEKTALDAALDRTDAAAKRPMKPVPRRIDPTNIEHRRFLGEGWFGVEEDHRWVGSLATVRVAAPRLAGDRLVIRGYSPHSAGATVSVTADKIHLGSLRLEGAGSLNTEFPLPLALAGQPDMFVEITVDQVFRRSGDIRELGLSITAIELVSRSPE